MMNHEQVEAFCTVAAAFLGARSVTVRVHDEYTADVDGYEYKVTMYESVARFEHCTVEASGRDAHSALAWLFVAGSVNADPAIAAKFATLVTMHPVKR